MYISQALPPPPTQPAPTRGNKAEIRFLLSLLSLHRSHRAISPRTALQRVEKDLIHLYLAWTNQSPPEPPYSWPRKNEPGNVT